MKKWPDKSVDLIVTDPPYGIKMDKGFEGFEGFGGFGKPIARRRYEEDDWDKIRPTKNYFDEILRVSKRAVIIGGNYFADLLPQGKHWLVWDKLNTMPTFGDCELIWTNVKRNSVKKYTLEWNGLLGKEKDGRYHPTQKPVRVMSQIIQELTLPGATICDPFMGSGSTGVACIQTGRKFIGIEKDTNYFKIAEQRISSAQPALFVEDESLLTPRRADLLRSGEADAQNQLSMWAGDGDE